MATSSHEWALGDPLESPEQELLEHALVGKHLDLTGGGRVDHEVMPEWGPERTVRAVVLRHLLVEAQWRVHSKGVWLRGARISGQLDFESATVRCPLLLEDCYLDSPDAVVLDYATVSRIVLSHCRVVGGLTANFLVVTKELDLGGTVFEGVISLLDADITGQLSFSGAHLNGIDDDGTALVADEIKVGAAVFLDQVIAAGAVRLPAADITGMLGFRGTQLNGRDGKGTALSGERMKVGADVFFDREFTAVGAVKLHQADIAGQLSFSSAQLKGRDGKGRALLGDAMKVGSAVALDEGFTTVGAVRLVQADITGPLSFRGAQLNGRDDNGTALNGDGMKVGANMYLDQGFTAAGKVFLAGARIGGSVWLNGANLAEPVALQASGVRIGGEFRWAPRSPVRGLVDLERAAVHRLDDDWSLPDAHWPPAGQLRLAGFTYDGFGGEHQASWQERLDWIRRSHTPATATMPAVFASQPYEQLARVYRQVGQDTDARRAAIARRNDLRRYGTLTCPRKLGSWLLDKTIRHGYQPLRAVGLLVVLYVAMLLVAWGGQHYDSVIVPAKDTKTIAPVPTALHCSPAYPCFYPAGYAVDVVVPIINLRQAENWRLNGQAAWGWAYIGGNWVATGFGWAFTTLAVVGYTGLIRTD
jgi:hypothetical protein